MDDMVNDKNALCPEVNPVVEQFLQALPLETSHRRMRAQEKKCGFGLAGTCCRLCSNGPCKITPQSPRGVCGADADTIAARSFLRSVAAGCACYLHVLENAALELKHRAEAHGALGGPEILQELCRRFGLAEDTPHAQAAALAGRILADIDRPAGERLELLQQLAHPQRLACWRRLGLLPGGAKAELLDALVKSSTNLSSDPGDMLLHALRLGVVTGNYGLLLTGLVNDVLLGSAQIHTAPAGPAVLDPGCVNILITGHQPALLDELQRRLEEPDAATRARALGAQGVKLVGCTCVGEDCQLRARTPSAAFCGQAGNNYDAEALLSTGCVDLVVSEFNCTIPGIEPICDALDIGQICLDSVAKKRNARLIPYRYDGRTALTDTIVSSALDCYARRTAHHNQAWETVEDLLSRHIGVPHTKSERRKNPLYGNGPETAVAGVTERTLKALLGGSYQPLLDAITAGSVHGIAGVVGCSNLRAGGHDVLTVALTQKLIQNNVLVLAAGCTASALAGCGLTAPGAADQAGGKLGALCHDLGIPPVLNLGSCISIGRMELIAGELAAALGVDVPDLPLVVSAPQWLEEQALADGSFALALGLTLHLGLPPFVTGSKLLTKILTEDLSGLTGGQILIEADAARACACLLETIDKKRRALHLS